MQRSFESSDRRSNCRVHIRQCSGRHTRRKRGSIQLVIGVQDQRNIQSPLRCLRGIDRKSTRLNSSHLVISYAVFCLKKKIQIHKHILARGESIISQSRQVPESRETQSRSECPLSVRWAIQKGTVRSDLCNGLTKAQ